MPKRPDKEKNLQQNWGMSEYSSLSRGGLLPYEAVKVFRSKEAIKIAAKMAVDMQMQDIYREIDEIPEELLLDSKYAIPRPESDMEIDFY